MAYFSKPEFHNLYDFVYATFACRPLALQAKDIDVSRKTTGCVACSAKGLQSEDGDYGSEGTRSGGESAMKREGN